MIPILLRPVAWEGSPFAQLSPLPSDGKPVTSWADRDEAFASIARDLGAIIEQQQASSFSRATRSSHAGLISTALPPPARITPSQPQNRPATTLLEKHRRRVLDLVRKTWITGVLERSLYRATLIELGLENLPASESLANPWRLMVQETDLPADPLPLGTSMIQVYDTYDGELLILGEPGAGKTTLLLDLTRLLLARAEKALTHPLPVVLNLASWSDKQLPLATWLIEELQAKYQVPHPVSQDWVTNGQLLLLLDGLDEVTFLAQAACIDAINTYRQEQPFVPMVVCCRRSEYLALGARLLLNTAVVVQPLTLQQIDAYLSSTQGQLEAVRVALREDPILLELATTPLMLNVLALTYQGGSVEALPPATSLTARRRQIFEQYTQRMLRRRSSNASYAPQHTRHWLTWLAQQLLQHNQVEFSPEQIQPDWLPKLRTRRLYRGMLTGSISGLIIGLLVGLVLLLDSIAPPALMLLVGGPSGLCIGLLYGTLIGLLGGLAASPRAAKPSRWFWQSLYNVLKNKVVTGIIMGPCIGLCELCLIGAIYLNGFVYWPLYLLVRLIVGLVVGLLVSLLGTLDTAIQPVESLRWSWRKPSHGLRNEIR